MERNMFSQPEVANRLNQYIKVKLYTDKKEEPYISNRKLQEKLYSSIELPLYVIISPDGTHLGTKTFTRSQEEFVEFLEKGLLSLK